MTHVNPYQPTNEGFDFDCPGWTGRTREGRHRRARIGSAPVWVNPNTEAVYAMGNIGARDDAAILIPAVLFVEFLHGSNIVAGAWPMPKLEDMLLTITTDEGRVTFEELIRRNGGALPTEDDFTKAYAVVEKHFSKVLSR